MPNMKSKTEANVESKFDAASDHKPESKAPHKANVTPVANPPEPKNKAEPTPEIEFQPKVKAKVEPKSEEKTISAVSPELVKRVHALYEELGREEVKAVENWESKKDGTDK